MLLMKFQRSIGFAVGYRRLGNRIMRVDMVERVAMLVREAARGVHSKLRTICYL